MTGLQANCVCREPGATPVFRRGVRSLALEESMTKPHEGGRTASGKAQDEERQSIAEPAESEAQERRRRFAKAMARSAFGRFYWDERLDAEMRRAMTSAKRRKD